MKIVIIGAGSAQFSANIVRDLCVNKGLYGSHVTFVDINDERLDFVLRFAAKLARELDARYTFSKSRDIRESLRGADFVINTAAVAGEWGGAQAELLERHGYYRYYDIGDLTQMVFFLETARLIEAEAPNAWLIQSANPVFEGCTLVTRETSVKTIGLCHGHYGYLEVADVLGLEREHVQANMVGFNHWIWMTEFRYKGADAYPLVDRWIAEKSQDYWAKGGFRFSEQQMSPAAIQQYQLYGLMPIGDTPRFAAWWQNTDLDTKKRWFCGGPGGFDSPEGWAAYVAEITENLNKMQAVVADDALKASDVFPPKQSGEQIVPIINSLVNDVAGTYQVNIPNRGHVIKGFPEDLVIECRALINSGGVYGIDEPRLPQRLMAGAMYPRHARAEAILQAAIGGRAEDILSLLLLDWRTKNEAQAQGFLDEWLGDKRNVYVRRQLGMDD